MGETFERGPARRRTAAACLCWCVLLLVPVGCLDAPWRGPDRLLQTADSKETQTAGQSFYRDVDDSEVVGLMNIVIKTPGRCGLSDRGAKVQTLKGEHQDYLLGQYVRSAVGAGIEESVKREKQVFALATNGRCHWNSLQNFCRSLLMDLEEPLVDLQRDAVLLPPGADPLVFKDLNMQSAIPHGFWPVAIRNDNLGEILLDDLGGACPALQEFVDLEAQAGTLGGLLQDEELGARFDKLRAAIAKQLQAADPEKREPALDLFLDNLEQSYEKFHLEEHDLKLEDDTRGELDLFYWMFMYAKYASSPEVVNSMVHPVVSLLLEKIGYLDNTRESEKSGRDHLVLLSVSDKLMVALNAFLFRYSHDCFKKTLLESPQGKNFCPGKVLPTSNIVLKIDQVELSEKLIVLVDGAQLPFCVKNPKDDCPLKAFTQVLQVRLGATRRLVPCRFHKTLYLAGYYDLLMAKAVLGLGLLLAYYFVRCGLLLLGGADRRSALASGPEDARDFDSELTSITGAGPGLA